MNTMIVGWLAAWLSLSGHAAVVDGDTLYLQGKRVRLYGIDAMELNTMHGNAAKWALVRIINNDTVTCKATGSFSRGRYVAKCSTPHITDLSAEMVKRGHALDCKHYSQGVYRTIEAPDARIRLTQAPYCEGKL